MPSRCFPQANLILWGRDGEIVLLEVCEGDPVADRVPEIADLCTWEDLFARRAALRR
jgi:hypothetical protein